MLMNQIAPTPSVTRSADPMNSIPALGRVLVVEDDPSVQKVLKHLFEAEGYTAEVHGDGHSAPVCQTTIVPAFSFVLSPLSTIYYLSVPILIMSPYRDAVCRPQGRAAH